MDTLLRDNALFSPWDIGTRDFYFDIKDLVCIMLGILLPVGVFDGLDFVRSFMKWFGHCFRDRHVQCSRYRLNFSLHVSQAIKIPDSGKHVIAHRSGNLV